MALAWAALVYHLQSRQDVIREQAHHDVENLSIAVERHVERLLAGIDQVMRFVADDFANDPETFDFGRWLKRSTSLEGVATQIALFNETGELVASREPMAPGMPRFDVRDRAYFQALAARSDLGLYVDRTVKGRITGRDVLQTARRLDHRDGSFAGVIVTSVDPGYLSDQFKAVDIGRQGSIGLFGHDGYIRARHPRAEGMYDQDVTAISTGKGVFAHLRERPAGTYEAESAFDHVTRIFGYRTVGSLPLIVIVGKSLDEVMRPFQAERRRVIEAGLGVTALLLALLAARLRALGHDRRHTAALAATNRTLSDKEGIARAAEAQAREANRLLSLAVQVAHIGHWHIALPSNALSWSEEVFHIFGGNASDGMPTVDEAIMAYHPDDRAEVGRRVAEAVRDGKDFDFTARAVRPDGGLRDVVSRGLCETDDAGTVIAVFGTVMDVTELRQSERAVAESEHRYRMLADTTNDMITHMDPTGRRLFVSPGSRGLLGYEPAELVGTSPVEMIHPDDAAGLGAVLVELAEGRREHALNVNRLRHRAGHWIWVEASLKVLRSADGLPVGIIAAIRDITDRMRAEDALRESERRFRLLAENTSELIMLGHDDGRRSYVSPASERLLGFTPEELGAMRLRDYVHPDDLADLHATTRHLGLGRDEVDIVYRARHRTRGWVWVAGVFRRIPDAEPGKPSIVATFRDVSELKAQSRHLEEARLAAEQASQAKTDFLATMSHEIRTPLSGIIGYTDLLLDDAGLTAGQRRRAERIQSAGAALLTVVNDILDFSKIEAGQVELNVQPFRLDGLIDDAMSIVHGSARSKRLDLTADVDATAPRMLVGDHDRLRQILLNLLNNAIKFTPVGTVTLAVSRVAGADDASTLRFAVSDTGIGIPDEKRARLFQRFSQVDGSIQRTFGGTGLGLAISKSLVELMHGEIGVDSTVSRGSTFWFTVRLGHGQGALVAESVAASASFPVRPARILLVEDLEINQELARSVLEAVGHRVDVVGDGADAIMAVQAKAYDLVLMDVQMPGMDGIAATSHIRSLDHPARAIPIIAMTANVLPQQVARFRSAGMNDHVGKPFRRDELHATVERWMGAGADATGMARPATPGLALDRETYGAMLDLLGAERMHRLLGSLATQLAERLGEACLTGADPHRLASEAHMIVSTAGSLGFTELSGLCAELEGACNAGREFGVVLGQVRTARQRALREIAHLRRAA